jgi:hypothetical protein
MRSTDRQTRKRRARGALAALLLVVLAALLVCAPGAQAVEDGEPPPSAKPYASLEDAVAAEAIDPNVVSDLERRGHVEALVNLDAAALIEEAEAAAPEGDERSRAILDQLMPALAAQKQDALASTDNKLEVVRDYEALPTMVVRFESPEALLELVNRPQVGGIGANQALEASVTQSLPQIRQPQTAAQGATGAGTAMAILDTGLDFTRPAFGSCTSPGTPVGCRVAFAQDFGSPDGTLDQSAEGNHGTNVAGIATSVAPGARILALDVFESAAAFPDDILAALDFVTRTQPGFGTRAVNMSFGLGRTRTTSPCNAWINPFVGAFAAARSVGIAPVTSTGNDAFENGSFIDGVTWPACTPGAIAVGAVHSANVGGFFNDVNGDGLFDGTDCSDPSTAQDQVACFSQSGPLVSVLAPGALINAAGITMFGTSQAAPHVTGAVAVLAGARPQLSVTTLESAITRSGPSITDPRNGVAKPRLDLRNALAVVNCIVPSLLPPIIGTPGPDTLTGTIFPDVIIGLGGNDMISGIAGNDVLCGGEGFDTLTGGPGADLLQGDEQGDFLDGGDHVDVMSGGDGNDWLEAGPVSSNGDQLVGGNGTDVADYSSRPAVPLSITLDNVADDGAAGEGDNVRSDLEIVYGGSDDDRLVGSSGANHLYGGSGIDVLDGGFGTDYLDGGPGIDTTTYASRAGWVEVLIDRKPNDGAPGERDDVRTENVVGGSGGDRIVGDGDANRLDGGPGDDRLQDGEAGCLAFCVAHAADVLVGGPGRDRADYSARVTSVEISLDGVANDGAWGEGDNVLTEDIAGGNAEDWLLGDSASNWISGGPGDDWLTGGAGPDSLLCGFGVDFAVDLESQDTQSDCEYVGLPQSDRPPPPLP